VLQQGVQQGAHGERAHLLRQTRGAPGHHIHRAEKRLLAVHAGVVHIGRQPQAVLRRDQVVLGGELHLHHATEGVNELAPVVAVVRVGRVGRHLRCAEHDVARQRVRERRGLQVFDGLAGGGTWHVDGPGKVFV